MDVRFRFYGGVEHTPTDVAAFEEFVRREVTSPGDFDVRVSNLNGALPLHLELLEVVVTYSPATINFRDCVSMNTTCTRIWPRLRRTTELVFMNCRFDAGPRLAILPGQHNASVSIYTTDRSTVPESTTAIQFFPSNVRRLAIIDRAHQIQFLVGELARFEDVFIDSTVFNLADALARFRVLDVHGTQFTWADAGRPLVPLRLYLHIETMRDNLSYEPFVSFLEALGRVPIRDVENGRDISIMWDGFFPSKVWLDRVADAISRIPPQIRISFHEQSRSQAFEQMLDNRTALNQVFALVNETRSQNQVLRRFLRQDGDRAIMNRVASMLVGDIEDIEDQLHRYYQRHGRMPPQAPGGKYAAAAAPRGPVANCRNRW